MPFPPPSRRQILVEIILIFAVFAIQGAWPVPDVNEPYYLGKAIHFWNPNWLAGDFFMESPDTHEVFYFTFGWLSLWLSPVALAWTGRILSWALLAWSWRRLSFAVVPRAWCSILTAALFCCLMDRCQMAGEWVIGAVEAKSFAYVFVFLGIEALVRDRWNRALLLFGAASAFHVLVGGWAAVAAGVAWLWLSKKTQVTNDDDNGPSPSPLPKGEGIKQLLSLWPGIVGGLLLALPGLIPSLTLDWGANAETVRAAHQIYVFERLPHHLTLSGIRPDFILRLALLWMFWLLLGRWRHTEGTSHLRAFVTGAVVITFVGVAINALVFFDRALAADLLRFYWFRLTDVALPLGVALEGVALIVATNNNSRGRTTRGYFFLTMAVLIAAFHVSDRALDRLAPSAPRSHRIANYEDWRKACAWVARPGNIPPDARFITPRLSQTFKWYTGRSEAATWKDVPQEANTLVEWWHRIQNVYATDPAEFPEGPRWYDPLATEGRERLIELGKKYNAGYLITERTDPQLDLDAVYQNDTYIIYRLLNHSPQPQTPRL